MGRYPTASGLCNGNPLTGQTVAFTASNGAISSAPAVTDVKGETVILIGNTKAGISSVTASLRGTNLSVNVNFVADAASAAVTQAIILTDNSVANGLATNSVKAVVQDAKGNPLAGQTVAFTTANGAILSRPGVTNASGEVTVTLTNTKAGAAMVTAALGLSSKDVSVMFMGDPATATVLDATVVDDGTVADGVAKNRVSMRVTDAYSNPVAGQIIQVVASNDALVDHIAPTNTNGEAFVTLTSTRAGISTVTATLRAVSRTVDVMFVSDLSTLLVSGMTVVNDNAAIDGIDTNTVLVQVKDARGNPAVGQTVTVVATSGVTVGHVALTNTTAGISYVSATLGMSSKRSQVTFMPHIVSSVTVVTNNAIGNGIQTNSVRARVVDAKGTPVAGQLVGFSVTNGARFGAPAVTDANGDVTVTNTVGGVSTVKASLGASSKSIDINFFVGLTKIAARPQPDQPAVSFYPRSTDVKFTPSQGSAFDPTCLTVTGWVRDSTNGVYSRTSQWGSNGMTTNSMGYYNYQMDLSNRCGVDVAGTFEIRISRSGQSSAWFKHQVVVPGRNR